MCSRIHLKQGRRGVEGRAVTYWNSWFIERVKAWPSDGKRVRVDERAPLCLPGDGGLQCWWAGGLWEGLGVRMGCEVDLWVCYCSQVSSETHHSQLWVDGGRGGGSHRGSVPEVSTCFFLCLRSSPILKMVGNKSQSAWNSKKRETRWMHFQTLRPRSWPGDMQTLLITLFWTYLNGNSLQYF